MAQKINQKLPKKLSKSFLCYWIASLIPNIITFQKEYITLWTTFLCVLTLWEFDETLTTKTGVAAAWRRWCFPPTTGMAVPATGLGVGRDRGGETARSAGRWLRWSEETTLLSPDKSSPNWQTDSYFRINENPPDICALLYNVSS